MLVAELPTPALVVDAAALEHNLATVSAALPGPRLRPHVKAHKCTALAHLQAEMGHRAFTCATVREAVGMAAAGLGHDLLVANEVLDLRRLRALAELVESGRARVTVAVDSRETVAAAAAAGVREVLVDVDVGLPRCGCPPEDAGAVAQAARRAGLSVRGVMGYEGHVTVIVDRDERAAAVAAAMERLLAAHADVGGEVVSAGSTVSFDLNRWATEIQAGSYALMDTTYAAMVPVLRPALRVEATVVSVSSRWAVADCGLKALGMDHGNPVVEGGEVLVVSDEHLTFVPRNGARPRPGDRVAIWPAHVDPTVAYHERLHLAREGEVIATWAIDLRGW